jgi:hypothetical protein
MGCFRRREILEIILAIFFVAACATLPSAAGAQTGPSARPVQGVNPVASAMHVYDAANEITAKGTVEKIYEEKSPDKLAGEHLLLMTTQGTLDVQLGPAATWRLNQATLAPGDTVSLAGAFVIAPGGSQVLLGRLLRTGNQIIALRSASGLPIQPRPPRGSGPGATPVRSNPSGGAR